MSILNNVGVRTMVSEGRKESTTSVTLYSVIYNLTNKTITFCANEHYNEDSYTFTYSFEDFFK